MSKRSLFWGNASGKLGEAVYYRAGGEQRTRAWVPTVKNPRSHKQAVQRTLLNNLTAAYKSVSAFIKQVNQPEKASMSAFNQFVKNNATANHWVADKSMIDNGYSVPANLLYSRGDLNVPTEHYNESGSTIIDLAGKSVDVGVETIHSPYIMALDNALPEVEFSGTQSATAAEQKRGFLYGKEFFQIFSGSGNFYNLPAEYAVFILCATYADEGFRSWVMGVRCSNDSNEALHVIAASKNAMQYVGNPALYMLPANGTLTAGSETAAMRLSGTTEYTLGMGGQTSTVDLSQMMAGVCVAYRDDSGVHASPCYMTTTDDFDSNLVEQWMPEGEVGMQIISQYETSANTLV